MGGFKLAQVGFKSPWAGVGPLVLMGGCGFARHGQPRVLGLVVVAENGFLFFYFFYFFWFVGMDLAVVDVDGGSGGGSGSG